MNNQQQRIKRHVYLPGLSAYDANHTRAATNEMGFQGDNNEYEAGSIFVDTQEAHDAVTNRYALRHTEVLDKLLKGNLTQTQKSKLQREYRGLKSAINNVNIIDPLAPGFNNQQNREPDILFVKGHGNPNNANSISTTTALVDHTHTFQRGVFSEQTDVRIKRGFRARHTAQEVGTSINNISKSVNSPGLDVRITSCGSGGTPSRDDVQIQERDLTQTFAGQVSSHLDQQQADQRVRVSGYQGDSNSTFPRNNQPRDGFVTKIKQHNNNLNHPDLFQNAVERQTDKLGQLTETMEPIKKPLRDLEVGNAMKQLFPAPQVNSLGASHALQQRIQPFTKIVTTSQQEQRMVAYGPRMQARVQIARQNNNN